MLDKQILKTQGLQAAQRAEEQKKTAVTCKRKVGSLCSICSAKRFCVKAATLLLILFFFCLPCSAETQKYVLVKMTITF